jgi:hypothetical protein
VTLYSFSRRVAADDRDRAFPMRRLLGAPVQRISKHWPVFAPALNQGQTGTCVGHAWKGWMLAALVLSTEPEAEPTAFTIYREAARDDEWTDNDGEADGPENGLQWGTSVRAAAKALQKRGLIGSYTWAWDAETAIDWLCRRGPVCIGVNWYQGMVNLGADAVLRSTGRILGGHAVVLLGWSEERGMVRVLNSWGSSWGQQGRAWLPGELLDRLIREQGEAVTALEVRL